MHNVLYSGYVQSFDLLLVLDFWLNELFLTFYKANIIETDVFSYCMTCRKSSLMIFFISLFYYNMKLSHPYFKVTTLKYQSRFYDPQKVSSMYLVPTSHISQECCKVCWKVFISLQKKNMNAALCIHSRHLPELQLFIVDFVIKTRYIQCKNRGLFNPPRKIIDMKGPYQLSLTKISH